MQDAQPTVERAAGDAIPPACEVIEVHVAELRQLFNSIDPSPFRERDLDPGAEEFIVAWAREAPRDARLALLVHLDRPADLSAAHGVLREAVREFFSGRGKARRQRLRQLFRVGRRSLLIGVVFLAAMVGAGSFIENALPGRPLGAIVRESLLIGGWVAMWRPLEIFLYDWWPIRAEMMLFDRLSAMPVRVAHTQRGEAGA